MGCASLWNTGRAMSAAADPQHSGRTGAFGCGAGPATEWRRATDGRGGAACGGPRRGRLSTACHRAFGARSSAKASHRARRVPSLPAHYPPVVLPSPGAQRGTNLSLSQSAPPVAPSTLNTMRSETQTMAPPPPLPPVIWNLPQSRNLADSGIVPDAVTPQRQRTAAGPAAHRRCTATIPESGRPRIVPDAITPQHAASPLPDPAHAPTLAASHSRNLADSGECLHHNHAAAYSFSAARPDRTQTLAAYSPESGRFQECPQTQAHRSSPLHHYPDPARSQMVEQLTAFHTKVSAAHPYFLTQQERALKRLAALYNAAATMPAMPYAPAQQPGQQGNGKTSKCHAWRYR